MRNLLFLSRLVVLFLLAVSSANLVYAQRKPRVAVLNFTGHPEGQRITEWAVVKLGESKVYTLLERDNTDFNRVMKEIDLNQIKDLFDPKKKVSLGSVQGVEILVLGKVDTYKVDEPKLNKILKRVPVGGVNLAARGKWVAQVKILFKMVNAATTEIMDSAPVEGIAKGSDIGSIMDDKLDEEFRKELLNRATLDATVKFVAKLEEKARGIQMPDEPVQPLSPEKQESKSATEQSQQHSTPPPKPEEPKRSQPASHGSYSDGDVVYANGEVITIYHSSTAGMKVGDKWKIRRVREELKDANGNVVGKLFDDLGEALITEIQPTMLVGKYSGAKPAEKGDHAVKLTVGSPARKKR
ncbi:MAG: CsgG/HfaB family protein [Blastocatellales bacterium]